MINPELLTGPERPGARGRFAWLAARHGYFDQAHLTRDFRRLVGASPGVFVARTERECGLHHDDAAGFRPWVWSKVAPPCDRKEQLSWWH